MVIVAPINIPWAERIGPKRLPKRILMRSIAVAKKSAEASTAKIGRMKEMLTVVENILALKFGVTKTATPTKPKKMAQPFLKVLFDPRTKSASKMVAKRGTVPITTATTLLATYN